MGPAPHRAHALVSCALGELRTSSQALTRQSRIALESSTGASNKEVAAQLGVETHTVSRWRARFVRDRLEGLTVGPHPGGPRRSPTSRSRKQ
ncbi:helix-turn-helix domain-containing protein [Streptomyces canus]|uniref:helix-turn-helix domain-containing protein n=1 Tax=Streptomyces canus TaxID=58343 RepID=UPI0036E5EDB4